MRKQLVQILIFTIVVFISSCNNDTRNSEQEIVPETKEKRELTVIIQFKSNKADNFKLSLNNIVVDEFQKKNVQIIEKIEPSSGFDEISASFGENNISNNLVINFGNRIEKTIIIESIDLFLNSKNIRINNQNFDKYFKHNNFLKISLKEKITLNSVKVGNKLNPVIFAKPNLIKSLLN